MRPVGERRVAAEQPFSAALSQHWSRGSVRKHELPVPHEQQLGWKTPTGTTDGEVAKGGPVTKKREVEKGEMFP